MKTTDVINVFLTYTFAQRTTSKELLPAGTRGRITSLVWTPAIGNDTTVPQDGETGMKLLNGSGGDILHEERVQYRTGASRGARGAAPTGFPENGIVFTDGVYVQGTDEGMSSISVCYQGTGQG